VSFFGRGEIFVANPRNTCALAHEHWCETINPKKPMFRILTCTVLVAASLAAQSPRYLSWIPADAELVAHVDLSSARTSVIGRRLLRRAERWDLETVGRFTERAKDRQLEIGRDFVAVTVYSTPPDDVQPVLILTMSKAAAGLFDDLQGEPGYWAKTIDGRKVHSFRPGRRRVYSHVASLPGDTYAAVCCLDLDQLFQALEVIEGDAPSLVGSSNPLARIEPRPGRFLHVAVTRLKKLTARNPTSNLLKQATGFQLEAGESGGEVFAQLTLEGKSEEACDNIVNVAQGLIALARLVATNEDTPRRVKKGRRLLLNAIDVASDGREIHVNLRCSAEKLAAVLGEK